MAAFERYLLLINRWALIVILAVMAVVIFANITMRYLTSESLTWAEEVARHLMIWLTFLGAGPVLRYGGHISIDNLQDALPSRAAIALRAVVVVHLLAYCAFMVWYGGIYVDRTHVQLTTATQIPFSYIYLAMPIGGILLALHLLFIVRSYVRRREYASDDHFDATATASL
jgi:TRAP-type C4-dicarboxylate transport system permease small subunit